MYIGIYKAILPVRAKFTNAIVVEVEVLNCRIEHR